MKEILARWQYRPNWREFVGLMRRHAARGNIHALAELELIKPDADPWREQSLRAAVGIRLMFLPNEDCDPTQVIGDTELDQLVKDKLGTWRAGVWGWEEGLSETDNRRALSPLIEIGRSCSRRTLSIPEPRADSVVLADLGRSLSRFIATSSCNTSPNGPKSSRRLRSV